MTWHPTGGASYFYEPFRRVSLHLFDGRGHTIEEISGKRWAVYRRGNLIDVFDSLAEAKAAVAAGSVEVAG